MEWIAIGILFVLVLSLMYRAYYYPSICTQPTKRIINDVDLVTPRYENNFNPKKDMYNKHSYLYGFPKDLSVDDVIRLVIKELDIQKIPANSTPETVISRKT